ncbi:hypothetical protein BU26DRAFT_571592 [Trematosphaeria pertusa]|uniref:Uncharacterized protein n=1 Tax=Trematosphaeria pertusa TaxID=390896 RepID=A0A6A6HV08_9PLEO|nr:uncharacterized protein BU26DRAFT_571592 [Trematosphaeria pertusa]KAF2241851.1 hypothetical protein BU26DRAFT_571592 [Trematosphaeria pertusa]
MATSSTLSAIAPTNIPSTSRGITSAFPRPTPTSLPPSPPNRSISPSPSPRNGGYMEDLKGRDQSCPVSGIIDFCEQAHPVPAGEREWWDINMGKSSDLGDSIGAERDAPAGGLAPVVRCRHMGADDEGGGWLVVYVVRTADVSNQFAALWHNVEMQKLVGVGRRCLFARVAWAVLSLHHEFLSIRRLARDNLLVRMKGGGLKEMVPEAFKQFSRSRSRNPSLTKRPRLQALEEDNGVIVAAELGWGDEAGNDLKEDKDQQLPT